MSPAAGARDPGLDVRRHAFKLAQGKFPARIAHELPTHEREKLRREAIAFIHMACFRPDATHYQLLNVPGDAKRDAIKESYHLLMALIHPDRAEGAREAWPADWAQRANRAYAVLADEAARAGYDRELRAAAAPAFVPRAPARGRNRKAGSVRRRLANAAAALAALALIIVLAVSIDVADDHFPFVAPAGVDVARGAERPRFLGTSAVPARDASLDVIPATSAPRRDTLLAPLWRDPAPSAVPPRAAESAIPVPARETPAPEARAVAQSSPAPAVVVAEAAPAKPAAPEPRLTSSQIEILVARLIGYYEAGEADNLMALVDAREGGAAQATRMRQAYAEFFRATRQRRLLVKSLDWQPVAASAHARGQARVEAELADASGAFERDIDLDLEIALRNGEARITRLSLYPNAP